MRKCRRRGRALGIEVRKADGTAHRKARRANARRRDVWREMGGSFQKNGGEQGQPRRGAQVNGQS
jgi:hypothetical protein